MHDVFEVALVLIATLVLIALVIFLGPQAIRATAPPPGDPRIRYLLRLDNRSVQLCSDEYRELYVGAGLELDIHR